MKNVLTPYSPSAFFPDVDEADQYGLLAVGGDLEPDWLLDAYSHGIFPWPFSDPHRRGKSILGWFSVDPRGIFEFERFHISRRLARTCRSGRFRITADAAFETVIRSCATVEGRIGSTWITPEMIDAYIELHRLGFAHSVEAWRDDRLVGGVYGVSIHGLFAAESMFSIERDASKVALVALVDHLQTRGFRLIDIQVPTPHTERFGAVEISRDEYLARLHDALQARVDFGAIRPAS